MSSDWDIDSYKTDYENEEHWELKKKFMLAHKNKFPEDELVCLAQVFTNIEFMGCRYPDKTMIRVAELAKGVVEKYREGRKNSLKRTFVAASDAASSKVKGTRNDPSPASKIRKIDFENSAQVNQNANMRKDGCSNYSARFTANGFSSFTKPSSSFTKHQDKTLNICSNSFFQSINTPKGPFGDIVLILNDEKNSISCLSQTASINKCAIRWEVIEITENSKKCELFIKDQSFITAFGENIKTAKEKAANSAIDKLRKNNYAIKEKSKHLLETTVTFSHLGLAQKNESNQKISEDNVGRKLLKLMGWEGGGLGSKNQGIEEPVEAVFTVQREGLGLSKNNTNTYLFKKKAKNYIRNWLNAGAVQDLVFSNDFTSDERKILHMVAHELSLKSKSYGKKNETRRLIISRKLTPWEIVQDLHSVGGKTEKYELLYPLNLTPKKLN